MTKSLETQLALLSQKLDTLTEKIDDAAAKRAEQDDRLEQIEHRLDVVEHAISGSISDWIQAHWRVVMLLSGVVPIPLVAMCIGMYSLFGDGAIKFLRDEIQKATVSKDILFQPPGLSFVRNPVYAGGVAQYVLVAGRTTYGAECKYETTIPIFMDELGNSAIGAYTPAGRQYGTTVERAMLNLPVPDGLVPGRVTIVLQIDYGDCGYDETYPVAFELLEQRSSER